MIRVLAIGKKHESWIAEGVGRYQKRLKKPFELEWILLPHSAQQDLSARENESQVVLSRLKDDDFVILLDERGKLLDSPALSTTLLEPLERSRPVVMIIGGAYGVNEALHQRANLVWSLSPLVFPHQLVRLVLTEQIYRAQEIAAGNPYHHV